MTVAIDTSFKANEPYLEDLRYDDKVVRAFALVRDTCAGGCYSKPKQFFT